MLLQPLLAGVTAGRCFQYKYTVSVVNAPSHTQMQNTPRSHGKRAEYAIFEVCKSVVHGIKELFPDRVTVIANAANEGTYNRPN